MKKIIFLITIVFSLLPFSLFADNNRSLSSILKNSGEAHKLHKPSSKNKEEAHNFIFDKNNNSNGIGLSEAEKKKQKNKSQQFNYENQSKFNFQFNQGSSRENMFGTTGSGHGGGRGGR